MVRGYSDHQAAALGFDRAAYKFPTVPGKGTCTLVMKIWGTKCLICYFVMDDGEKLKLSVFREHVFDRFFYPEKCSLDMSEVEIGSIMEISYGITKNGRAKFLTAKV